MWACWRGLFSRWKAKSCIQDSASSHHGCTLTPAPHLCACCLSGRLHAVQTTRVPTESLHLSSPRENHESDRQTSVAAAVKTGRQRLAMGSNVSGISTLHRGHQQGFHRLRNSHKGQEPPLTTRLATTCTIWRLLFNEEGAGNGCHTSAGRVSKCMRRTELGCGEVSGGAEEQLPAQAAGGGPAAFSEAGAVWNARGI